MAENISRRKRNAPITTHNPKRQQISHDESSDSSSEDERDFGQRTPPLIEYIKGILNSYPDGSQILKEIIQNADDAEATEVAFLLDYTKHSCVNLIKPVCSLYQGEALYSWNNAKFKTRDWEGIRNIGISGKVEETLKVGRFGLGFVAVYHITDVPMILSNNSIGILDPQQQIYPNEPGKRIKLKKFFKDPVYSAHQNCFRSYFDYNGLSKYDGTIFRFPLRNKQSKSKIKPAGLYTADSVMTKLFKPLQEEFSNILIFLKSVKSITLYTKSRIETKKIFSINIPNNYIDDVVYSNRLLSNHVEQKNFHKSIKVTINLFPISSLNSREDKVWLVLNMIGFPQSQPELYEFYSKSNLNYLPWIGIAMETGIRSDQLGTSKAMNFQDDWDGNNLLDFIYRILEIFNFHLTVRFNHKLSADTGKLFCFLPTPEPTDLPFNLHGYFALSNDRRQIKWPSVDSQDTDSTWNKLLIEQLGVSAYAIFYSILLNSFHHDNPGNYHYQMLGASTLKKQSSILIDQGLKILANEKIVYSRITNEWIKIEEGIYLSDVNTNINCPLEKLLKLLKEPLVLLPTTILTLFNRIDSVKNDIDRRRVTPALLRQLLVKHSNNPALNLYFITNLKGHTFVILNFILSDFTVHNSNFPNQLDSIPLLKVATPHIFKFFINPKTYYYVYDDTFDFVNLFPGTEGSFVDRGIPTEIYSRLLILSHTCKGKINLKDISNIKTDLDLLKRLFELSIKSHFMNTTPPLKWNPNFFPFNKSWIKLVWSFIGFDENLARSLGDLPLLPTHDLYSINNQLLPIVSSNTSNNYIQCSPGDKYKPLENILLECGSVFIHSHKFIECLDSLVLNPIPNGLLTLLQTNTNILNMFINKLREDTNEQLFELIIDILNNDSRFTNNQIQLIKKLPIFPTINGNHISIAESTFVRVPDNIYLPSRFQYPANFLSPDIYNVNTLYGKLGITAPDFNNFLINNILPFMQVMIETNMFVQHFNLSKWLLNNLDKVSYQNIQVLKTTKWIVDNSNSITQPGNYCQPNQLFYPDDDMLQILLPSKSNFFVHKDYKDYFHMAKKEKLFFISTQLTNQKMFEAVTQSAVCYFHLDINVPNCNELWRKRFSTLLQFVTSCWKSSNLNTDPISRILLSSSIVLPSYTRPGDYPKCIPFLGERKLTQLQSVVFCNDIDISLIASVRICVQFFPSYQDNQSNELLNHLNCNTEVTGGMMAEQLNKISLTSIHSSDPKRIHSLLNRIYSSPSILTVIDEIVTHFVYVKHTNSFIEAKLVARNLDYSLEPFYYSFEKLNYSEVAWKLFENCGANESLSDNQLYQILDTLYQSQSMDSKPHNVKLILNIIHSLYNSQTQSFSDHFLLGVDKLLHLATECVVYDNPSQSSKKSQVNKNDKMYFIVNSNISRLVASKFGAKSFKLTMLGDQFGFLKFKGQFEELTTRLRSILKEYESNIDVYKELLQNADDAKANTARILIDYNSFPTDSLIEPTMEQWQGPALYFYDDAQFTDADFDNIMKIFGETKLEDKLKIGKFGLGFNTVYHLTDLPSFVSGRYIHMLDPNRKFLVDQSYPPGIQVDFVPNNTEILEYRDQFSVFNLKLFDCNVFKPKPFNGTLFRLPFRTVSSDISGTVYNSSAIGELKSRILLEAESSIRFLQHIKCIEIYEKPLTSKPVLLLKVSKKEITHPFELHETFISKNLAHFDELLTPPNVTPVVHHQKVTITCERLSGKESKSFIISYSTGIQQCIKFLEENSHRKISNYMPVTSVALPVNSIGKSPAKKNNYYMYCYLPLPVTSPYPMYINGCFALDQSRRGIACTEDGSDRTTWNIALINDSLVNTFINLFVQIRGEFSKGKKQIYEFYRLWPLDAQPHLIIWREFPKAFAIRVMNTDTPLFYYDLGNEWIGYNEANFIFYEDYSDPNSLKKFYNFARRKCLQFNISLVDLGISLQSTHLFQIILQNNEDKIFRLERICREVIFPNFSTFSFPDIKLVLTSLLPVIHKESQNWVKELFSNIPCIPCGAREDYSLLEPSKVISPRSPVARLYCPSDKRTIHPDLDELFASKTIHYKALKILNIIENTLPVSDLIERCECQISFLNPRRFEHCMTILQYLNNKSSPSPSGYKDRDLKLIQSKLVNIKLIPVWNDLFLTQLGLQKSIQFASPSQCYSYDLRYLMSSNCYAVTEEVDKLKCIETFLSISETWKSINIHTLTSLLQSLRRKEDRIHSFNLQNELSERAGSIYTTIFKQWVNDPAVSIETLNYIWHPVSGSFRHTSYIVSSEKFSHYRCKFLLTFPYKLNYENKGLRESFLQRLEIKENISQTDAHRILDLIARENSNIHDELLIELIIELTNLFFHNVEECLFSNNPKQVLLSTELQLCPGCELVINNMPWEKTGHTPSLNRSNTVHERIHPIAAFNLGAKSKRSEYYTSSAFEEFGQYEDIADRIRGLKRAFPYGTTILKELLQNAEDAGATEVAFILDTAKYSSRTNSLCLSKEEQPNWHKYQKYTSLLVYNNSTFSDKDLQGIQSVGLGGKKDSPTIGKFGLGFNAVYNLTDSPCLLTRRNNGGEIYFCIFDPFRKFLKLPPQNLPGMKFTFKSENIDHFPDQFIPYSLESLNTTSANTFPTLTNGDYTIFRIPIMESSIETKVEEILSDFLKNSSNFNLFLNNIQRISIYKRDKDNTTMMGTFKLLVTPLNPYPPPVSLECKFLNTIQITKREIIHEKFTTISPNQPNVSILGKRNRSYPHTSSWILFTHEGSMKDLEKCSPQITKYKSIYEREKLTHQVYGGIAVHVPTDASCRTPTGGSCLYSYLPIGDDRSVNFPILINAPFILEPERQHIRFRDVSEDSPEKLEWGDVWHSSIIQHVIAPLFASLLIYLKSRADTELTNFIDSDYYDWYYSLYPDMGKLSQGNQVYINFLYALCKQLYILMYSSNEKILISKCYERLHPLHGEHGAIFPDSSRRLSDISSSHKLLSASKNRKQSIEKDSLYLTLKKLSFPLTGAPDHIYHSFKKFSCYLTRLDQTILLSFLNQIEYTAFNALILSMEEIDILLEYLFSAKPECILLFQKIPLKIDFNGGLGDFTKTKPTFTPAYGSLLPHRAGMFVSSIFPINSIQILCAHGFMQELSPDYLSNNLEVKEFQLQECCLFWKFILQSGLQSYDLIQKFGKFPLVPIKNNPAGEYTLISNLPAILNTSSNASSNKELYSSLIKLNCYILCLDILAKDDFNVSTLAMYLQPLTISSTITFPLFISAVKLSDINIECVRFDKSEATSLRNLLANTELNELTSEEVRIISLLKIFLSHQDVLCCIAQFDNFYIHNSTYNIGALLTNKLTNERVTIFKASKKQEALIKHIAKTRRIHMVTESDFFLVYVLRYFTQLNINEQRGLLLFIQNTPTSYGMDFIHELKSVRFIHRNRLVSDCYSPEVGLFKIFFSDDLLPNEWSNTDCNGDYSQILRTLGLHDKADLESILTAAQKIESRKFPYTSSDYLVPLSALAQLISEGINFDIHKSLLQQLSKIEFLPVWKCIPNSSANTQIISSFSKAELCEFKYSCCMATHIHNPLVSDCYTYTKKYNTGLYLNIRSKPDIQTVISHLKLICDNFNEIHVNHHSIMDNLFIETYGFLQENCSQNLKNKFTNIKCIYYENKLFYPRNMVFSLNSIILEYLFKVPDALKSYHAFLRLVGVSESADYFHYAAVMNDIYHDRPLRNEQRKEISKTTFQLFISTLRKAEQSNCTINIDPLNTMVLSDIYEIVPIPNVVYIDNTRLKIHIESFPSLSNLQFLLELPPNSLGSCKPPVSLKIKHLSEIISATLDPALKNAGTISRYRNECREMEYLLKCREFAKGLIRIYYHSNIADGKGDLRLIRIKNGNVKDISKEPGITNDPLYLTCFQILQKLSITIVSTLSMQITEIAGGAVITKDGIYDCFIENSVLYANGGNIKNVNFFYDLTYALNLHFGNIFSDMLVALQLCLSCDNTCDIMKKLDSFNIQACPFIDDINLPSVKSSTSLVMRTTPISSSRLTPSSTSTSHYPTATRPAGVTRATLLQIIHTPPIRLISNTISAVISNEDKFIAKLWIRTAQCDLRAAKKLVCEEADGAIFPPHACANCFECAMKTCIAILYINKYNKANISCQRNLDILLDIVKIFFKSTIAYNNFSSLCVSLINFDENAKNPLMTPGIGCCIPMEHISVTTAREAIKNTSDILGIVKSEFPTFKELMFSEDDKIWIQPTAQSLMMTQIENFDLYPTLTKEELSPNSDEYSAVARNFMNTLPNATIMKVLKIHHKTCWDNFVKNIKRKIEPQDGDDGSPNFRENTLLIKPLFHGSFSTDPEVIIQDLVGFNVKYAKEGMWGRGIYFAQNASYSHDFAYKDSTGICSMFLSKVFVGNARYEEANSELRGPRQGYHSVTGIHPAGTKVYILYENGLAYPGYLINYRPGTSLPS